MSEYLDNGIMAELVANEHPTLGLYYCNIYYGYSSSNYNMCNG